IPDGCGTFAFAGRNGTKAQDRARRADDAVETSGRDLFEMLLELRLDVLDELPFIARRNRIALHKSLGESNDADFEASSEINRRTRAPGDLDAAATDVNHHTHFAGEAEAVCGGEVNEPGFFGAREHPRANPGLCDDGVKKFAAVFRLANGARRAGDD